MVTDLQDPGTTRPPEVAPPRAPTAREIALFGGTLPTRPPVEVAPPVQTMRPIVSPGDPNYVAPPRPRQVAPAAQTLPEDTAVGEGDDPTFGVNFRVGRWQVDIDTPIRRPELPSVSIPLPGLPGRSWRIHTSPFDRQQAYIAEHGRATERVLPTLEDAVFKSAFGMRNGRFHSGFDVDVPTEDPQRRRLVAPVGGFVSLDRNASGAEGVMVTIYGDDGNKYKLLHLRAGSIPSGLDSGDRVEMGQLVGVIGNTGVHRSANGGPGTHLHLIVETPNHNPPRNDRDFTKVNPTRYFPVRGGMVRATLDAPIDPENPQPRTEYASAAPMRRDQPALPSRPVPYNELIAADREGRIPISYSPDGVGNAGQLASPPRPEGPAPRPVNIGGITQ